LLKKIQVFFANNIERVWKIYDVDWEASMFIKDRVSKAKTFGVGAISSCQKGILTLDLTKPITGHSLSGSVYVKQH
jgi:hypothetical protein